MKYKHLELEHPSGITTVHWPALVTWCRGNVEASRNSATFLHGGNLPCQLSLSHMPVSIPAGTGNEWLFFHGKILLGVRHSTVVLCTVRERLCKERGCYKREMHCTLSQWLLQECLKGRLLQLWEELGCVMMREGNGSSPRQSLPFSEHCRDSYCRGW